MSSAKNSQGSIWRKWDLHVHTPLSIVQHYGGDTPEVWEKFILDLESLPPEFKVIGINDYLFLDGYKKVLEYKAAGRLANLDLILPVVEFRLKEFVGHTTLRRLNYHIIFADESLLSSSQIESQFLNRLSGAAVLDADTPQNSWAGVVSKETLADLGREIRQATPVEKRAQLPSSDLELGFNNINYELSKIEDFLGEKNGDNTYLKNNYFKAIGKAEWQDFRWDGSPADKKTIINGCHFVFSAAATPEQSQASKDKLVAEGVNSRLLHCSDAHKFSDSPVGEQKIGSCFTWIKADPTFEGLRQAIFEPVERVRIQNHNPYEDQSKLFFSNLKLSGKVNFILPDFELALNRELIAIIGGRGSGKSALLDTFAFLNEEHLKMDQNRKRKVIEYYRENEGRYEPAPLFNLKATLVNKDGESEDFEKKLSDHTNLELPFLYLGQEQLSGIATNDFELTKTVCQLIGINVNEIGQESIIARSRSVLSEIENTKKLLSDIVQRYIGIGYKEGTGLENWIQVHLSKLTEQQVRLSSKQTKEILEDINKKTERGLQLNELEEKATNLLADLKRLPVNESITKFNVELTRNYPDFPGLALLNPIEQVTSLETLLVKIKSELEELRKDFVKQKQSLISQGIKEDVNSLIQASENLQRQISGVEKDLKSYTEAKTLLEKLLLQRDSFLLEIKKSLEKLRDRITEAFSIFQQSRTDSPAEEKELFEKIIQGIGVEGKLEFDQRTFVEGVLTDCFDNRKVPNENELKKIIAGENEDGTAKDITFDNLASWVKGDLSSQKYFNRGGSERITEYVFTQWPSFLRVKAIATLNGKPTEVLSIGQRGTLLLKVYLATSTVKQVFIIDQPEDNLDNSFIMHELVPLIRRAKQSRQIIMSTHNANLVVNADADQVIVACLDNENTEYISGGIENGLINERIKEILEGGEEAFRSRERKYSMNN